MSFCLQFNVDVNLQNNITNVLEYIPILRTQFVNDKAIIDIKPVIQYLKGHDKDTMRNLFYSSFDMTVGPLCRSDVDKENDILFGCIHRSIADGRSMPILFESFVNGQVKERKYILSKMMKSKIENFHYSFIICSHYFINFIHFLFILFTFFE